MGKAKWEAFLRGEDAGAMIAPLVDRWCLDTPYFWPYDTPEPFQNMPQYHSFREQLAMAAVCGYDPLFYVAPPFVYTHNIETKIRRFMEKDRQIIETWTETPYGKLLSIGETTLEGVHRYRKPAIEDEDDYRKYIWMVKQERLLDKDQSIDEGRNLLACVRDMGMTGTWWAPPEIAGLPFENAFYHMMDYPDTYREAIQVRFETDLSKLETLKRMGFDFLFYIVPGTEIYSPAIFEEFVLPYTEIIFKHWRSLGGFIVWHSCGHVTEFIRRGYYERFMPEIFETLSERPEGDLVSLKWARERLNPRIATKGNIRLPLIRDGKEEELRAQVVRVLKETKGYRHIVGGSDNIMQGTPVENFRILVDEAHRYAKSGG